jgi:hypothetical protein
MWYRRCNVLSRPEGAPFYKFSKDFATLGNILWRDTMFMMAYEKSVFQRQAENYPY